MVIGAAALLMVGLVVFLSIVKNNSAPISPSISNTNVSPSVDLTTGKQVLEVAIQNFAFSPQVVNVKVGTQVKWTNEDSVAHDVTSDENDGVLRGELLDKGESYTFTFNQVGTYNYHCHPHPNMQAKVVVTE